MPITALSTPPSRNDPANFASRADMFLAELPTFAAEANILQADVNSKQTAAATSAANALASENAANAASNASVWVSGTTYAVGNVIYSPITYLSYRRKTAGAGTTDPSADNTNWQLLNGTGNVDLTSTQTLTNKTFSTGSTWNGNAVPIANGGTGATTAVNAFDAIKQNATETATGVVELATTAELETGVDTTRVLTVAALRTSGIVKPGSFIQSGNAAFDFTSIPSWVTRITIGFNQISTNGTSPIVVRLGTGVGIINANYAGSGVNIAGTTVSSVLSTTGFQIGNTNTAATTINGNMTIVRDGDFWFASGIFGSSDSPAIKLSAGWRGAAGVTTIRVTTVSGTELFDNGYISIFWE